MYSLLSIGVDKTDNVQPLFFWASPVTSILWLIGASGVTILGHAALMEKDVAASFSEEAV